MPQISWFAAPGQATVASEDDCLEIIDDLFPERSAQFPGNRDDDCAHLESLPAAAALSTDFFWENAHFRTAYFTPAEAGAKALSSAVSDLAAAGAIPLGFSLGLMLPGRITREAVTGLLTGMAAKARDFSLVLTGGDLSRSPSEEVGMCVTVWGKAAGPSAGFLERGGARPGDVVFLVGRAGLAGAGFRLLEMHGREALLRWPACCAAHLEPTIQLAEGQTLARLAKRREGGRVCLMDLSDGLLRDLPRLVRDKATAWQPGIDLTFSPDLVHPELAEAARELGLAVEELFLLGGEDYALIGTCAPDVWEEVSSTLPTARLLGRVTEETSGLIRNGAPLTLSGFDHFAGDAPSGDPQGEPMVIPAFLAARTDQIAQICETAWKAGLMAGFSGNASLRVRLEGPEASGKIGVHREACLITRSGAAKGRLGKDDFVLMDLETGQVLAGFQPSSEASLHLEIYRRCPQSRAILHSHPPHLQAVGIRLAREDRLHLPLFESEAYRNRLAFTPPCPPGSGQLAVAAAEAAACSQAVWLEEHGLVTHGPSLEDALALTEELEQLARVQLLAGI